MKISDYFGLFSQYPIELISSQNPFEDYFIFDFKIPQGLSWKAGEHAAFIFPKDQIDGKYFRAFSFASSPREGILKIATRSGKNVSSFKQKLIAMKAGDTMTLRGPVGWMRLQDESTPVVLIGGGVGITPFRAILKEVEGQNNRKFELLYSANGNFLFQTEISELAKKSNDILVHFVTKREEFNQILDEQKRFYENDAYYFISGSPSMIKAIRKNLKNFGIKRKQILTDPFFGY